MKVEEYIHTLDGLPLEDVNRKIEEICGIKDYFADESESCIPVDVARDETYEYGDWQTNRDLANNVVRKVKAFFSPQVIIEPTCGKGSFVLSALEVFDAVTDVYAIEIYEPYLQQLKHDILQGYLDGKYTKKVRFHLMHCNVFDVEWRKISSNVLGDNVLIIGNPPWVTNSGIGRMNGDNLPRKANIKKVSGLSAMTGKGNFDIAEYICYQLFQYFSQGNVMFALLLKNSVIRQICQSMPAMHLRMKDLVQQTIDARREFGASVDASLFTCRVGDGVPICEVSDFYSGEKKTRYGWVNGNFVSNIETYQCVEYLDGISPIIWRSGVKHDCQSVLELEKTDNGYINRLGETVDIEEDCIYPYVKSSDIQTGITSDHGRFVVVTQRRAGDNPAVLKYSSPRTFDYLLQHRQYFEKRKSSVYNKRPEFSMFGIGEYTFKPFKIVISSLYKKPKFVLLSPINGKCVIPDDTCYLVGFDTYEEADYIYDLLCKSQVNDFINSVSFNDAKRIITKELLMRINLQRVSKQRAQVLRDFSFPAQQQLQF